MTLQKKADNGQNVPIDWAEISRRWWRRRAVQTTPDGISSEEGKVQRRPRIIASVLKLDQSRSCRTTMTRSLPPTKANFCKKCLDRSRSPGLSIRIVLIPVSEKNDQHVSQIVNLPAATGMQVLEPCCSQRPLLVMHVNPSNSWPIFDFLVRNCLVENPKCAV